MTKLSIKAKIQSELTGRTGLLTYPEHEEFLHTDPNSFLENIYPDIINEADISNSITVNNANINYKVKIVKIGREVTLTGSFQNVSGSTLGSPTVFSINPSEAEYLVDTTPILSIFGNNIVSFGTAKPLLSNEAISMGVLDNGDIYVMNSVGIGEAFLFTITYNALN